MALMEKIVVQDFRNIALAELSFSPNVNCISGNNGEGKTNLIDAVYYLSMTKSAFSPSDRYCFRHGTERFSLAGTYAMGGGLSSRFSLRTRSRRRQSVFCRCRRRPAQAGSSPARFQNHGRHRRQRGAVPPSAHRAEKQKKATDR